MRDGAIIFSGLIGKLDVLRVECLKYWRSGRYRLPVALAFCCANASPSHDTAGTLSWCSLPSLPAPVSAR
jgi:hypothetical protein